MKDIPEAPYLEAFEDVVDSFVVVVPIVVAAVVEVLQEVEEAVDNLGLDYEDDAEEVPLDFLVDLMAMVPVGEDP